MNVIQQIGAYAGFAAVIGLAVLSALYFSQARDVRRLREWASRSPDRDGPTRGPADARSSAREAAPMASAGGAGPATAASGSSQATAPPSITALRPPAPSGPPTQAPGRAGLAMGAGVDDGGARTAARPVRGARAYEVEAPARANGRPGARSSLPYVALAVVGLLIVLGAAAFALGLVGGRSEPAATGGAGASQPAAGDRGGSALAPGQVTFSVLNGTNVDGLGRQVADELEAAGYRRGNVTNAGEQRATSVVMYAQSAQADARSVARRLHIDATEPADSASQTLAGDATVIVLVGADRTQ